MFADEALLREIHADIVALYSSIRPLGLRYRRRDRALCIPPTLGGYGVAVYRDQIVNALLNRAATTQKAILTLVDGGMGEDAMALARVLLDVVVGVAWMLTGDWPARIDRYAASSEKYRQLLAETATFHYDQNAEIRAAADRWAAGRWPEVADLFTSDRLSIGFDENLQAIGTRKMLTELLGVQSGRAFTTFLQDVVIDEASVFVHTTPRVIQPIVEELRQADSFDVRPSTSVPWRVRRALLLSNGAMLVLLAHFSIWSGAGLDAGIEAIQHKMLSASEPAGDETPTI